MVTSLAKSWEKTVRTAPDAVALIAAESGRTWTRAELAETANAWRAGLPEDVRRELSGRRVGWALPNGVEWWTIFLGVIAEGAVAVPMDANEPVERQAALARKIGAAWWWREGRMERVGGRRARRKADEALVKLTSGSTGEPKALAFTAAQMIADGRQICATMGITAKDVNLAVIPCGHSYGLGNLVMPLLLQGTAMVVAESPLPQAVAAACARGRATVFPAVPAVLRALARAEVERETLGTLRRVISAGAALPEDVAVEFAEKYGRAVHGFYGTSETGGICYDRTGAATRAGRGVGAPLKGVKLVFRRGGRFVVKSAAVGGRGEFSPPDCGELDARSGLVLRGRAGRGVKIGGRRLEPGEVEAVLRTLPGVGNAWVTVHPQRADALAAAVEGTITAGEVRRGLEGKLAPWKRPARVRVMAEFPLTVRGKTDTRRLRALLAEEGNGVR
jgi:acyl-CoA synthetase (AMP-forming)/AMP-acid ligase II